MENGIKIYHNDDEKFVKVKFEFIMNVPIDNELTNINDEVVHDAIMNLDSSDLADTILDNIDNCYIIKKSDKIKHIKVKENYVLKIDVDDSLHKIEYLSLSLLIDTIQCEMNKGNKFTIFSVKSNEYFTTYDLESLINFGYSIYRENNDYYVSWDK
jgi:hypothetical protein